MRRTQNGNSHKEYAEDIAARIRNKKPLRTIIFFERRSDMSLKPIEYLIRTKPANQWNGNGLNTVTSSAYPKIESDSNDSILNFT